MVKLLDKLLFNCIWAHMRRAVTPCRAGGTMGEDIAAWLVSEFLALRRQQYGTQPTYAAFIDGENAFVARLPSWPWRRSASFLGWWSATCS